MLGAATANHLQVITRPRQSSHLSFDTDIPFVGRFLVSKQPILVQV
jgi:hypothetical protein